MALAVLFAGCAKKVSIYEPDSQLRENLIQNAMNHLGKPYRSGAKGPDSFDCSGFVHYVYKQASLKIPVTVEQLDKAGSEIDGEDVLPGDLILFRIKSTYHVGIMLNKKEFIHSSRSKGVSIDSAEQPYWKRGLLGFRRIL